MKFLLQNKLAFVLALPYALILIADALQLIVLSTLAKSSGKATFEAPTLLSSLLPKPVLGVLLLTALVGVVFYLIQTIKRNKARV